MYIHLNMWYNTHIFNTYTLFFHNIKYYILVIQATDYMSCNVNNYIYIKPHVARKIYYWLFSFITYTIITVVLIYITEY